LVLTERARLEREAAVFVFRWIVDLVWELRLWGGAEMLPDFCGGCWRRRECLLGVLERVFGVG